MIESAHVAKLFVENGGRITLPEDVIDRYQLGEDTTLRIIETRNGILLVPLTDEPMSDALRMELEDWQVLGGECFERFPFEDDAK